MSFVKMVVAIVVFCVLCSEFELSFNSPGVAISVALILAGFVVAKED